MTLGKSLRQRRLSSQGRSFIGLVENPSSAPGFPYSEGPVAATRSFVRGDLDAVAVSPGLLERIGDDLASLALILRLNLPASPGTQLISLQGALEMGAEAVLLTVNAGSARDLDLLGRVTEDSRRLGMPVIAEMLGEDLGHNTSLATDFGADMIQLRAGPADVNSLMQAVKLAGRPVFVRPGSLTGAPLVRAVHQMLDLGVEGILLDPHPEATLAAIRSLCHQGASLADALAYV